MNQERIRRRNLPHWDVPNATYFLTTCLDGSIPAQGLLSLQQARMERKRRAKPAHLSAKDWQLLHWKWDFKDMEQWLDFTPARRDLEQPALAQLIVNALQFHAGERYDLLAYVIMPSHMHWLFTPRDDWIVTLTHDNERTPRERIQHSINRYTARECNLLLQREGTFWQKESYDHWVRDENEMERIIHYIEGNPVKAGLAPQPDQWPFSSASIRARCNIPLACPISNQK